MDAASLYGKPGKPKDDLAAVEETRAAALKRKLRILNIDQAGLTRAHILSRLQTNALVPRAGQKGL